MIKYKKKDMYLVLNEENIKLYLNQLDVEEYNKVLQSLNISSKLTTDLFQVINSIGSYGIKGKKRMFVGYNVERKVKNRKVKEIDRSKHYYANKNVFSKKNNELPIEYKNKIICGDSLEVLNKLPDNCIDIIFTSPPYNFGLEYENHNDTSKWVDYFDMLFRIFKEGIRVLKYGGRFVVNIQPLYSDYIPAHHMITDFFIQNKMIWKGEILWEKNNYNCKYTAWGSWKSPSSPYLKYTWEFIEVYCKGTLKKEEKKDLIDISEEEFKSWVVAKWSIAPERNMKKYDHPAMFPEVLVERVLKLFSFKEDIVLDPFNGAGTTTAVAQKTGRYYIGVDISEAYCNTAQERINETNGERTCLLIDAINSFMEFAGNI